MREKLLAFHQACLNYDADGVIDETLLDRLTLQMPTVREVLKRLDPALAAEIKQPDHLLGASGMMRAVQEGIGILNDQDEWPNLAPDAPSLIADRLHPHVWDAASALWDTEQYRVAVGQAAVSLSAHIASRAGSSLAERELVAQVFAPSAPAANQVRLHLPGDKNTKTWRSRQEGLHLVALGAFAGIRNVAIHTDEAWSDQVALEHLALLSVVARWADDTEIVRA
jgi:uncharacterized protein (TIGR02391 family)